MGNLKSKLESALAERLAGATVELELIPQSEKWSGQVVWDGFYGKPQRDRQKEVSRVLQSELTSEEQALVSIILTLTPAEEETYRVESVRL